MLNYTRVVLFFSINLVVYSAWAKKSDVYTYRTISEAGLSEWNVQVQNPLPKQSTPEKRLKKPFTELNVSKKVIALTQAIKKNPSLAHPKSIALIGDTGCRLKESKIKSSYQDCSDPLQWRYPEVINSLIQDKPDLIIHVGDYHYREQCSPGKPCNKMSPETGYDWAPWKLDFFEPSRKAFSFAPWVMVRGNHEDCSRAFLGYKLLLRNSEWKSECEEYEEPQVIVLGDLAIINLDSSSISDMPEIAVGTDTLWKKRLDLLAEKLKTMKVQRIWLVTHKPIYGLVSLGKAYAPLNINLRKYFEATSWANKIELILGGHIHNSQLTRALGFPLQLVIGNGGTSLDKYKEPLTAENISALGYEKAKMVFQDFGYALIKGLDSEKPTMEFHDSAGAIVFSCHLKDRGQDCF